VKPALEAAVTLEELEAAISDPEAFLQTLLTGTAGPAAKKMAIARLRRSLEPKLKQRGLEWDDVLPSLQRMTNIEELVAARDDPHSFVEKLALSTKPAVKKAALERERAAKKQATKLLSKEKKAAPLNPALIPAQYKMLYVLFFDSASKLNMVAIIKEVAKEFFGVVKNSAKVQLRRLPVFAPPAPMQRRSSPMN
jgi:hypothetical protein